MGSFKQFHHFVSLAAIFKPRWWAFVTRAPCFFKKVVPFTHLTLNWSCNPGERNSWSQNFWGDMLINCYSQYVLKECPVVSQVTTWAQRVKNSEASFETSWQSLSKSALSYCYALWGGRGVLLCLDQILNNIMVAHSWYDPYVRNQGRNLGTNWPKSHFYSWQPIWALKRVRKRFDGS